MDQLIHEIMFAQVLLCHELFVMVVPLDVCSKGINSAFYMF